MQQRRAELLRLLIVALILPLVIRVCASVSVVVGSCTFLLSCLLCTVAQGSNFCHSGICLCCWWALGNEYGRHPENRVKCKGPERKANRRREVRLPMSMVQCSIPSYFFLRFSKQPQIIHGAGISTYIKTP